MGWFEGFCEPGRDALIPQANGITRGGAERKSYASEIYEKKEPCPPLEKPKVL